MKPSAFFRSFSLRIPERLSASPAVAPFPIGSPFGEQVMAELDALKSSECNSAGWLLHALNASISTQKITLESLSRVRISQESDRNLIDGFLEDNVKVLDACNGLSEKIEILQQYVESVLRVASRLLVNGDSEPSPSALARARDVLDSCEAMERRCGEMEKCSSSLRNLLSRRKQDQGWTEFGEVLSGSQAVALMACGVLGIALSFKSRRGSAMPTSMQSERSSAVSYSWSYSLHELQRQLKEESEKHRKSASSMMLDELQRTVKVAKDLRAAIRRRENSELKIAARELQSRCSDLEGNIQALEKGVKELYKHLISVRIALLGILSQA